MNDTILKGLIELYEERGLNLHALLDDPLFEKQLSPEAKIKAVKLYAEKLSANSSPAITKEEIKRIILSTAGAGVATAVPLMLAGGKFVFTDPSARKMALLATGIGSGLGLVSGILDTHKSISNRRELHASFDKVINTGRDEDAVKVLALRNLHNRGLGAAPFDIRHLGSDFSRGVRQGITEGRSKVIETEKTLQGYENTLFNDIPNMTEADAIRATDEYKTYAAHMRQSVEQNPSELLKTKLKETLKGL